MLRCILILWLGSAALPGPSPQTLARVNGVAVGTAGAPFLIREMKREGLPITVSGLGRDLVTLEALRQMAVSRGLDQRSAIQARQEFALEDALAAVCQERLRSEVPAYSGTERNALGSWIRAHALTQYELHRIEFETLDEAKRYQGPRGGAPGTDLDWFKPFWARPQDPELNPGEARLLDQMIASGKACQSTPYRRDGKYRVLVFAARSRKVDPLLFQELGGDSEPEAQRLQSLIPEHHLRRTLERLRAEAKLPPLPAPELPLSEAQRNGLESEARRLFAQEARRRSLDREFADGIAVTRAWALAQGLLEEDLAQHPITEADLKEACLRDGIAPVAFRFESRAFATPEAARAALKFLKAKASPDEAPWAPASSLPARTADALRRLALGAWTEDPVRGEGEGFLLLRLVALRPEPGFEATLERRRDALLSDLRQRRWYDLGAQARQRAKILGN